MPAFPPPKTGEVTVRVRYLAVNNGFTYGEVSAEVVAVGAEVGNYAERDTLLAFNVPFDSLRQHDGYFTTEAIRTIPIANATPEIVALAGSGTTAAVVINEVLQNFFGSSQTILITAAAQAVGHIAVQLAKQAEQRVIGIYTTDAQKHSLLELGVSEAAVVHHRDTAKIPDGVDILFETDGQLCEPCLSHLAMNAQRVTVVPQTTSAAFEFWLPAYYQEHGPRHMTRLCEMHRAGTLRVTIDSTQFIGANSISDALEYVSSGQNIGQVVVRFE